ncbi:MAG: hypothetical protein CMF31_00190 [Kordiimonas sp.]|nr:hypothetical protein [Kordiimonas sp.]
MSQQNGKIAPARGWNDWSKEGVAELINHETGVQDTRCYADEGVYQRELEQIFAKCWICVGHESQIPNVGDFITTQIGEDPVIVTRDRDNSVHVLLNQCRHRGVKVARGDYGNSRSFTCSYHGWCFGSNGDLLGMPQEDAHNGQLDKSKWGLKTVAKVDTYKGLIFATWDENAEPLLDYLGEATWYMDGVLDRSPGGIEIVNTHKWRVKCNWKWGAEQHVTDFYHAPISHISYISALVPEATIHQFTSAPVIGLQYSSPELGHGTGWFTSPNEVENQKLAKSHTDTVIKFFEDVHIPAVTERLGKTRALEMTVSHMNIFPNLTFNKGQGYMRLWQPIGPNEMEVISYIFVDKDWPDHIKEEWERSATRMFSPAGPLEQDDAENAFAAQMGVSGHIAGQNTLNIQMGDPLDAEAIGDFEGPGNISFVYSELALRGFYRRWANLMSDD